MPSSLTYKRKTKGSGDAPYGRRKDGTPRKKPGRHVGYRKPNPKPKKPKIPKSQRKKPGRKAKPPKVKNPSDMRGKVRINRGGFKKDGTPMPASHSADGRITKEGVASLGDKKKPGRPKGSFSMDTLLRDELRKGYGTKGAKTKGEELATRIVDQAISSPKKRGTVTRFLTERMDGKAVQPIKDVTPRDPLDELTNEELDALIAKRGLPSVDAVPESNKDTSASKAASKAASKDAPKPSPSPPKGRPTETQPSTDAPSPSKQQPKTSK